MGRYRSMRDRKRTFAQTRREAKNNTPASQPQHETFSQSTRDMGLGLITTPDGGLGLKRSRRDSFAGAKSVLGVASKLFIGGCGLVSTTRVGRQASTREFARSVLARLKMLKPLGGTTGINKRAISSSQSPYRQAGARRLRKSHCANRIKPTRIVVCQVVCKIHRKTASTQCIKLSISISPSRAECGAVPQCPSRTNRPVSPGAEWLPRARGQGVGPGRTHFF